MDSEAEGLLDGLAGEARAARLRLLELLESEGVAPDELRAAVAEGRLALLPVERVLAPPGARYTFAELARRAELAPDFLRELTRALGLPLPEEGEATFTDADVEAARTVGGFRAAGIPDQDLLEVTRVLGHSLAQVVAALRSMFASSFFETGDSEYDVATRWSSAARDLNPLLEQVVLYVLRAQQVTQLRAEVFDFAGLGTGTTTITVGFADLTGFTRLGEQLAADRLGSVAGRLTALATAVAQPPVRLVKMIGDAAMLVSSEPRPLLEAMLALVAAVDDEGEEFPAARAGIACGEALARGGDWFGQPVNLASRITDRARPGSVVVSAELKDLVDDDGYRWSRLPGRRKLKGIRDEVTLFRVRASEGEPAPAEPDAA